MCWHIDTPKVAPVETTARDLLPETDAATPESPVYAAASKAEKRGRNTLKIDMGDSNGYNPVNM